MFAEISSDGVAAIIAAVGVILLQLAREILAHFREVKKDKRDAAIAKGMATVKEDVASVKEKATESGKEVKEVKNAMAMVEHNTNSLVTELQKATAQASTLKGAAEERARAELAAKIEAEALARGTLEERTRAEAASGVQQEQQRAEADAEKEKG